MMGIITLTHKTLIDLFRKQSSVTHLREGGIRSAVVGMVSGSKNMIGIGVATATAGIVVGAVTSNRHWSGNDGIC